MEGPEPEQPHQQQQEATQHDIEADEALARQLAAQEQETAARNATTQTRSGRVVKKAFLEELPPDELFPLTWRGSKRDRDEDDYQASDAESDSPQKTKPKARKQDTKQAKRGSGKAISAYFKPLKDKQGPASASAAELVSSALKPKARHSAPASQCLTKAAHKRPVKPMQVDGQPVAVLATPIEATPIEQPVAVLAAGHSPSTEPPAAPAPVVHDLLAEVIILSQEPDNLKQPNASTKVASGATDPMPAPAKPKASGKRSSKSKERHSAQAQDHVPKNSIVEPEVSPPPVPASPPPPSTTTTSHIKELPVVSMLPQALRSAAAMLQSDDHADTSDHADIPAITAGLPPQPPTTTAALPAAARQRSASKVIPNPGAFKPTAPAIPPPATTSIQPPPAAHKPRPADRHSAGDEEVGFRPPRPSGGAPSGGPVSGGPASGPGLAGGMFVATNKAQVKYRAPGLKKPQGLPRRP